MKNYQKGFIPIILLIIAVLAIGVGLYIYVQHKVSNNIITNKNFAAPELCNPGVINKQVPEFQDSCYAEMAFESKDVAYCEKVKNSTSKDTCYLSLSSETGSEIFCKGVVDIQERDQCYMAIATKKQDITICKQVEPFTKVKGLETWYPDSCYLSVAEAKNDKTICTTYIQSKERKDTCLSSIK